MTLAQASEADILLRLCFHLDTDEITAVFSQEANDLNYLIFRFILPRRREVDSQRPLVRPVLAHSVEYLKRKAHAPLQIAAGEATTGIVRNEFEWQAVSREIQREHIKPVVCGQPCHLAVTSKDMLPLCLIDLLWRKFRVHGGNAQSHMSAQQVMEEWVNLKKLVPEPERFVLVWRELHHDEADVLACLHLRENIGLKREPRGVFACCLFLYAVADRQGRNETMGQRDGAQRQGLRYWSGKRFFPGKSRLFRFRMCVCQKPGMHLFHIGRVARQQVAVGHARIA